VPMPLLKSSLAPPSAPALNAGFPPAHSGDGKF
jgi:hypothetical protein